MNQYSSEQVPEIPENLPPARRRRAHRLLLPADTEERQVYLENIAQRISPSFDFYLRSLLAGAILGVGLLLNAPALFVLAALLSPTMAPVVGMALGSVTGSLSFFISSLISMLIGSLFVFLVGFLTGYAVHFWIPIELEMLQVHTQVSWINFLVLAIGATLTVLVIVRSEHESNLPNAALAYIIYLPLATAGIGLGSGMSSLWQGGLMAFGIYLFWGLLLGILMLMVLQIRPATQTGYIISSGVALVAVLLLLGTLGSRFVSYPQVDIPTPTITITDTPTPLPTATRTATRTHVPATVRPTDTTAPTEIPTITPTLIATPFYAVVNVGEGQGAHLRAEPGFDSESLTLLDNGALVQVLLDTPVEKDGVTWIHVQVPGGKQGWIVQSLLATATPAPNW